MDKDTIEALRKMQELNYRQLDSSAVVVAEMKRLIIRLTRLFGSTQTKVISCSIRINSE